MRPQFKVSELEAQLINYAVNNENKFIEALSRVGDEFVNSARSTNTYQNDTFNLRSSIGYVIANNGVVVKRNYEQLGDANIGVTEGLNLADEVAAENSNGIVLIVTAGMNYALYVEAKGFDVLTGSIPNESQVLESFNQMLK